MPEPEPDCDEPVVDVAGALAEALVPGLAPDGLAASGLLDLDFGIGCSGIGETGIGDFDIGDFGIGDFGIGDFGIGDFGIGDFGIGDFGIGDFGIGDFGIRARVLAWSDTGKSISAACPFIRPVVLSVLLRAISDDPFLPLSASPNSRGRHRTKLRRTKLRPKLRHDANSAHQGWPMRANRPVFNQSLVALANPSTQRLA
jgi:hypothetical protein